MEDDLDQAWRAIGRAPVPMRHWEGDCIVYNPLSGDTHILDIVAGEILRAVMEQPMQGRALARHIAAFLEVPDDDNTAANVNQILHRLDELGLIEPHAAC